MVCQHFEKIQLRLYNYMSTVMEENKFGVYYKSIHITDASFIDHLTLKVPSTTKSCSRRQFEIFYLSSFFKESKA